MVVHIDPPLIGQYFGCGDRDVTCLLLSSRHQGFTLYPVTAWPTHVYVARIVDPRIIDHGSFDPSQVELIAWGEIFPTLQDAFDHANKLDELLI